MKRLLQVLVVMGALGTHGALAVSVGELAGKCGDDAKKYCDGVGYGDAMTQCLEKHHAEISKACAIIVDRVAAGEKVTLF